MVMMKDCSFVHILSALSKAFRNMSCVTKAMLEKKIFLAFAIFDSEAPVYFLMTERVVFFFSFQASAFSERYLGLHGIDNRAYEVTA